MEHVYSNTSRRYPPDLQQLWLGGFLSQRCFLRVISHRDFRKCLCSSPAEGIAEGPGLWKLWRNYLARMQQHLPSRAAQQLICTQVCFVQLLLFAWQLDGEDSSWSWGAGGARLSSIPGCDASPGLKSQRGRWRGDASASVRSIRQGEGSTLSS